jgi:hypothetical protein
MFRCLTDLLCVTTGNWKEEGGCVSVYCSIGERNGLV